ncbi:MAG TPA: alpha/beta hydrolase [Nevskiaceae bacterium]|nr:alpha/beta hydrolase [Nevskiaceae bacterium]
MNAEGSLPAVAAVTLVLLPGLDGTDVFFRPLLSRLPAGIRALPLTLPDHGPWSYAGLLEVMRRELADVPRCYVLAASFGGPLAVLLAQAEPHKLRGLILTATFLRSPRPRLSPLRWLLRTPVVWSLRAARRLPLLLRRRSGDALRVAKAETWQRTSARSLAARARAALAVDVREAMSAVQMPVLAVSYAADSVVSAAATREILDRCRDARNVTLDGGHLAMFSDPQPLAEQISRFIEACEAPMKRR